MSLKAEKVVGGHDEIFNLTNEGLDSAMYIYRRRWKMRLKSRPIFNKIMSL